MSRKVLTIHSLIQYVRLKRTLIGATPLEKGIYLVDHMKTPFVMGVICPSIYLPTGLTFIEQEYIIAHEKIHIARFDYITRVFAFIALIIHWFNPLVWVAYFLSEKDMELSCDEAVIKTLHKNEQLPYAKILLQMATGRKMGLITPLAFGEGNPKDRIRNIMKYKKPTMWVSIVMLSIICIFTVILGSNRKENHSASLGVQNVVEDMVDDMNQEESIIDHTDIKAEFLQTELTHMPVATNARIENKTHLEQFDCVKVVVNQQNLDLTHDGIDDYIETVFYVPKLDAEHINIKQLDPNKLFDGGNGCYVAIYDGSDTKDWNELGTLLWEKSYYGAHAGNGQINIVTYEGETYLFATNLYAGQGDYDLSYEIFALESDGTYHILAEDSLQISTREPNHSVEDAYLLLEEEKQEILLFEEQMQQWIDAAKVLVITDVAMVEQLVSTLEKEYMSYPYYASIFQYYINDMIGTISGEEILTEWERNVTISEDNLKLVSDATYEYEEGILATMSCDVYLVDENNEIYLGTVYSMGTSYPICYNDTGIYATGPREIKRYTINTDVDGKKELILAESALEKFDDEGNAGYAYNGVEMDSSDGQRQFEQMKQKYFDADIVDFY